MKTPDLKEHNARRTAYSRFLKKLSLPPIQPEQDIDHLKLAGRKILLTGAAGSIGSELAVQLCAGKPAVLAMIDQSETALCELEATLSNQFPGIQILSFVADITDQYRLETIVARLLPDVLFHAAAYKHVVVMEQHPYEALKVNFFGTKILADLAIKYAISCMLLVSTDKAVRPTSVMGITKRLAELYIQQICRTPASQTVFITTRFGNVLGSGGSFTNILQNQIEKGGPVTVTHPHATRYFMTAADACQLVLHAFATGENGDIIFFDMGDRVPIVSVAEKMIRAYELIPNQDIKIIFIGLRAGEKLHEDLLNDNESVKPGAHPKTRIAFCEPVTPGTFKKLLPIIENTMYCSDDKKMVATLKQILSYVSGQHSEQIALSEQTIFC